MSKEVRINRVKQYMYSGDKLLPQHGLLVRYGDTGGIIHWGTDEMSSETLEELTPKNVCEYLYKVGGDGEPSYATIIGGKVIYGIIDAIIDNTEITVFVDDELLPRDILDEVNGND